MTFIDLNDSTSSLPLQEKAVARIEPGAQPKSPHPFLQGQLSPTSTDSPILALPTQHFLPSDHRRTRPRKSSMLGSPSRVAIPEDAALGDVALQMSQDSRRDWREIVDNLMQDDKQ